MDSLFEIIFGLLNAAARSLFNLGGCVIYQKMPRKPVVNAIYSDLLCLSTLFCDKCYRDQGVWMGGCIHQACGTVRCVLEFFPTVDRIGPYKCTKWYQKHKYVTSILFEILRQTPCKTGSPSLNFQSPKGGS